MERRVVREIETEDALERLLRSGEPLPGAVVKDLDLRSAAFESALLAADLRGTVFLGCHLPPSVLDRAQGTGALVFPPIEGLPFDPYRGALYTPDELYGPPLGSARGADASAPAAPGGLAYADTLDASIDSWVRALERPMDVLSALYQRLHDHAITDALAEAVNDLPVAGVMGGHDMSRRDALYPTVVDLGRRLTRAGFLVATGGGPGAMEAANLGAFLAPFDDPLLGDVMEILRKAPSFVDRNEWLSKAWQARTMALGRSDHQPGHSLGVPTWFYGHEPPNVFASWSAKYFENSVREDGLITLANRGIVFAPGSAGTVQEIFQDVTRNHYAADAQAAPMIFFGTEKWTSELPVVPLVRALAKGHPYDKLVVVTDDVDDVITAIGSP